MCVGLREWGVAAGGGVQQAGQRGVKGCVVWSESRLPISSIP